MMGISTHTANLRLCHRERERILPQDFSEEDMLKISEWLNFTKYGKSRLWYLIREWNEYYSSETAPYLSPDTPLKELLK